MIGLQILYKIFGENAKFLKIYLTMGSHKNATSESGVFCGQNFTAKVAILLCFKALRLVAYFLFWFLPLFFPALL